MSVIFLGKSPQEAGVNSTAGIHPSEHDPDFPRSSTAFFPLRRRPPFGNARLRPRAPEDTATAEGGDPGDPPPPRPPFWEREAPSLLQTLNLARIFPPGAGGEIGMGQGQD